MAQFYLDGALIDTGSASEYYLDGKLVKIVTAATGVTRRKIRFTYFPS